MVSTTTLKPHTLLPLEQPTLSNHVLSENRGYYRSKVFNTHIGVNPLVAAASPLFSLACFLSENTAPLDTYTLYQDLQHEIKAFENNAKQQHYRSETILVTRYLLCAFLDEIVFHSVWGKNAQSLLLFFHQERESNERFFMILERLSNDPELHIDILELIYLCLTFGYLGKYRELADGKETVEKITQRLFDCIRLQRGDLKKELHIMPKEDVRTKVAKLHFPLWLIVSFTFALLLTIYSSFSYMIGNNAEAAYQQINNLMNQMKNETVT